MTKVDWPVVVFWVFMLLGLAVFWWALVSWAVSWAA